ncbi:LysR family transcriptional regulator [Cryobacterium adonitolivorans]|uniref:LysR family transcriptional regulator n=1 Tax=Cryobacterium adonitolivorans TaxID=1259189 RepID=A0A4R8WAS6_9MICO|nr:LysR family transcriptional regulator [Cryobacterium adonitolivorans]
MDTTLLQRFVAVAEELDIARAAKNLNVSRTTLMKSVAALEAELGVALFEPAADNPYLTEAGIALLAEAKGLINHMPPAGGPSQGSGNSSGSGGGKAKASKGRGRAPAVKGQAAPGKRRQSR